MTKSDFEADDRTRPYPSRLMRDPGAVIAIFTLAGPTIGVVVMALFLSLVGGGHLSGLRDVLGLLVVFGLLFGLVPAIVTGIIVAIVSRDAPGPHMPWFAATIGALVSHGFGALVLASADHTGGAGFPAVLGAIAGFVCAVLSKPWQ